MAIAAKYLPVMGDGTDRGHLAISIPTIDGPRMAPWQDRDASDEPPAAASCGLTSGSPWIFSVGVAALAFNTRRKWDEFSQVHPISSSQTGMAFPHLTIKGLAQQVYIRTIRSSILMGLWVLLPSYSVEWIFSPLACFHSFSQAWTRTEPNLPKE